MSDLWVHPAAILLLGAVGLPLIPARAKRFWLLLIPILTFLRTLGLVKGVFGQVTILDWTLVFGRVDGLS